MWQVHSTQQAPLINLRDDVIDINSMIATNKTAVTGIASMKLGKERRRKTLWVTRDVLDLCDMRRDLNKRRYEGEGA